MSIPNWFASAMQMFGPKQQVVKPPLKKPPPKFTPGMVYETQRPYLEKKMERRIDFREKNKYKRGTKRKNDSNENLATKKMRKPSLPQLPLFGESMKRKSGSMESIATKKMKPSSSKRPGSAAFNPSKKMKQSLSSQKRSGSLGSLENMFAKKTRS